MSNAKGVRRTLAGRRPRAGRTVKPSGHVVAGRARGRGHRAGSTWKAFREVRDLGGEVLPAGRRRTVEQDERRPGAVDVVADLEVVRPGSSRIAWPVMPPDG